MIEQVKTVLLILLIGLSFVLSGLIWNDQPRLDNLGPSRYIAPQPIGHTEQMTDFVQPSALIFHSGDGHHKKALPTTLPYKKFHEEMSKWYFYDVAEVKFSGEEWDHLLTKQKGIEVIYRDSIPMDIFGQLFTIRGRLDSNFHGITRVWLYSSKEENMSYALFISDLDRRMLRARITISPSDMDGMYSKWGGRNLPEQLVYRAPSEAPGEPSTRAFLHPIYLPKDQANMYRFRYFYQPLTIRQVIETFFVDPNLTREVTERDGTMIYTDGSKVVSIPPHQKYLLYRDPAQEGSNQNEGPSVDSLNAAIMFVNQHGGWTGSYCLESTESRQRKQGAVTYQFRPQIDSYPLYGDQFGENTVLLQTSGTAVVGFQRPMLQLDTYFERVPVTVMSGSELIHLINKSHVNQQQITGIELGFKMHIVYDFMEIRPVWVIQRLSDSPLFINAAVSGKTRGGGGNGLE
ncbi:YycH family regulatory protein [Aneurinibacillus terranovensis]|uniref:YycH family regulatory protein n=1 Tax=Aneurinibacillus terranovensis TaxID=278991 RepID=UPI0003FB74FB|nr:two-component system activity regulator YycH [Aneurinibacillus terranovensis]